MSESIRNLIASIALAIFGITLFESFISFSQAINPGINQIYLWIGTKIAPNLVTTVIFDWRGYDTLGEALILVTAVIITLLIFGRGKVEMEGK
ncbi:MAG: EhbH [Methanobacteriaceae archaeon]|nr:EhbH [Methanobacteriaceae archaeon]MDZ4171585.1 EhbH [Methanobacteriaceae archaeon]